MEANSPFIYALVGLVVGFLIGLACYRLMSRGERHRASLKQTLLEREHQIAELKKAMGGHFGNVRDCLNGIRRQADELERQMQKDAGQWQLAHRPTPAQDDAPKAGTPHATPGASDSPAMPRDYADGKGGTLSEDFGLKNNAANKSDVAQPPRY
ncbi:MULTISPECIES: DUF1043 family protein [unclassified Halomonas]|uniref:YhcB family protein n=1 Tax=unclassified Halomonas TaxID=2609666 RepID=UPI00209F4410|nr:YhcB family protein [Halomonas sp. 707D7]MCP1326537.1 YhcB family protein [Halomonas sp. 707D4]